MNCKGNILLALKSFKKDLQEDSDYKRFSKEASRKYIVDGKIIHIHFNIPEVNTKQTRKLNSLILK